MTKISRKRKFFRNFAPVMPIHIPINILDFIFKGMLIGVIASAPMGPVGILCVIRRIRNVVCDGLYHQRPEPVLSADGR